MMTRYLRALAPLCALFASVIASAATIEYRVLIDADNSTATGCVVTGPAVLLAGIEHVLITTVDTSTNKVTKVERQQCNGVTLNAPILVDPAGWSAGGNSDGSKYLIETYIPTSVFGATLPKSMRFNFTAASGLASTAITTNANGTPVLYPPVIGRRHAISAPGDSGARSIVLDGDDHDWTGMGPLVAGAASLGTSSFKFNDISLFATSTRLFFLFRVKVDTNAALPPIAKNDTYGVQQGHTLAIVAPGVLGNDQDPAGNPLTAAVVSAPTNGTVTLAADGGFTYVNNGSSSPVDIFLYKASNGSASSDAATVTINVGPDNPPVALPNSYNVAHGGTLIVPAPGVLQNDSDVDGDPITAVAQTPPTHGTLSLNSNGSFTYTHDGTNTLSDTFTYRATDGIIPSSPATVSITVGPDAPPVAVADNYTVAEGATLSVPAPGLFANDSDVDTPQSSWTVNVVTPPLHGILTPGAGGAFTYTHDGSETVSDTFTYRVNDGIAFGNTVTVTITVTPVNDAPVANADAYNTNEDQVLNATSVLANDTDAEGNTLTASKVVDVTKGVLVLNANGTFQYTPNANVNGTDTFTYKATDNGTTNGNPDPKSSNATVTITIAPVNDVPTFNNAGAVTVNEDSGAYSQTWATAITPGGGADEAGQALNFIVSNNNNALFSAQPSINASGLLTFTPAANANGSATVSVQLHDNGGVANGGVDTTAVVQFTLTVNAVNDAPSFTKGANQTLNEDAIGQIIALWATAISKGGGADEAGQTLNFIVTNDNNALFSVQPAVNAINGDLTFTPAANAFGTATVSVSLHDNGGVANGGVDTSAVQTFTITINSVNDVPSFTKGADQTSNEDAGAQSIGGWATAISAGPANESGQTVNFIVSNNNNALFSAQPAVAANGTLTFTAAADAFGVATVDVQIHDNGGVANGGVDTSAVQQFTITINSVNDVPSFTKGADEAVLEDTGLHTVNGWATAISKGPANESAQTLTFNVNNDNNALFAVQPAISATGNLTYTLAANSSGTATVTVTLSDNGGVANGGVDTSAAQTFMIVVTGVNDVPSFTKGADETVLEDSGLHTVNGWATAISAGPNEGGQAVHFNVSNNNNALFSVQPAVSAAGDLTYTLAADANGTAIVTINIQDDGGTANGGVDQSADQTFNINVTAVNDAPSFTKGADQTVLEDSGLHTVAGWATSISKGPADESGQILTFNVNNNNNALFSVQPAISNTGQLTYTLAANAFGTATVTVTLSDDGGVLNGGVDTSASQTFDINVTAVNDAPSFTKGADQTVLEDSGLHTVAGWATAISDGPNESGQVVHFNVSNNNNGLFSVQPAVASNGDLTYTLAADANGTALVTINIQDDGGTLNGGVDQSANQTFNINVTAVNDAPSFVKGADQAVLEDSGLHTVAGWATSLSKGPADESGQILTFNVNNNNNALFSVQPAISNAGQLTYTLAANAFGTATVSVTLSDDGGVLNGGVDTSAAQTFDIVVTGVNDAPSFTKGADQTVLEDSGLHTVAGWATAISKGPANESGQVVHFNVSNNNNGLFSVQPAVASNGDLTYTLAANANGTALVTINIQDDGGTLNGGVDQSANQTFNINVTAVNDAPSFTKGADQAVLEDSGLHTVAGWATAISKGPADESGQILTFNVNNNNNALFSVQPAISSAGQLTYTLAANAFGTATVTVTLSDDGGVLNGGVDTSAPQTFDIVVTGVNDAPSFTKGADQTVLEDSGLHTVVGWATAISAGPSEGGQVVHFNVSNNNNGLFSVQPAVAANGDLTYTLAANANGTALVTINIQDDGGTLNGGVDQSANQTFNINVTAVNDAPSFTKGADEAVLEDTGLHTVPGWATSISKGPADESAQTLTFNVNNNNNALFSVQPAISSAGQLTYTLAANAFGTATVTVTLSDNGGVLNGGVDTSAAQTFDIVVTGVNDAPSFTKGADENVLEDSGPLHTVNGWATAISKGPANESGQVVHFNVSNNNNTLFSVQPAVSAAGVLTYTLAANANGTALVTINIQDDGGTANSGVDQSANQTFNINVTAVNDAPSFTFAASSVFVIANTGSNTLPNWMQNRSKGGGADENGQTLTPTMTNDNNALFTVQPHVNTTNGFVDFTLANGAVGSTIVSLFVQDNGGVLNGGVDTSATLTFTLIVEKAPDVVSTVPTNGGAASTGTTITINFDEQVNATTSSFTINCGAGNHPYTLSASPATTFTLTPIGNLEAAVCTVTVLSAQVTDTDTNDPPNNMASNYQFTFTANNPPVANDDTYSFLGNLVLTVDATHGVIQANGGAGADTDADAQTVTVTTGTVATAKGGSITFSPDGSFVYTPPAGYKGASGADTVTYTITDGIDTDTATVTLNVSKRVWFVKNNAPGANNGVSSSPFTTLAAAQAASAAAASSGATDDETIYIYAGDGTATGMNAGFTFKANQTVIGEGINSNVTTTLNGLSVTIFAGSASVPNVTRTAGTNLTLSTNNTLRGILAGASAGTAILGNAFGTFTTDATVSVSSTGGPALDLTNGTAAMTLASVSSSGGTNGVNLATLGGTLNVNGGTLSNSTAALFNASGGTFASTWSGGLTQTNNAAMVNIATHGTGTITFQTGTLNATNGTGLQFSGVTGTYNFNGTTTLNGGDAGIDITGVSTGTFLFGSGVAITNPSGTGFTVNSSSPAVTYNGNITKSNAGLMVDITTQPSSAGVRNIVFQTGTLAASGTSTGINLNNVDGNVSFNGTTTAAGTALTTVNTGSSGTIAFASGASMTNTTGTSFTIDSSNPTLTYAGSITKAAGTLGLVSVNIMSGGSATFSGTLSSTIAANAISVTGNTGATAVITFSGATNTFTTSTADAITLTNNATTTVSFTGGNLTVSTTSGRGLNATVGGKLNITGANNTFVSTTGVAVTMNAYTVDASGVTLKSVNVNGAAAAGIALTNIGTSGTFSVTGTGVTVGSGGTIQGTTAGITLNTMGATSATSFSNMTLTNNTDGITGTNFGTMTVANTSVNSTTRALFLNTGSINGTFSSLDCAPSGNNVPVTLTAVGGNFTVAAGTIASGGGGSTPDVLDIVGGNATIAWQGNVTESKASSAVNISGTNSGTITFSTGTITANNAGAIAVSFGGTSTGTYNFNGTVTANAATQGLVVAGGNGAYNFNSTFTCNPCLNGIIIGTSTGTYNFGASVNINNTTGTAIAINGTQPVVLYTPNITQTTAQKAIVITGVTGGATPALTTPYSIKFAGNITKSTNAATAIDINTNSGGKIGFTGATLSISTATSTGINISANTAPGPDITFAPSTNLVINNTSGAGLFASNAVVSGTLTVTGATNTITTTTGTALTITNTTIGASHVTFQTITAGTAGSGPVNGILLNTTGGSGHLAVSGGTIQKTTGAGISMTSTTGPSLTSMSVLTSATDGIFGNGVNGLTLASMTITNNGAGGADEGIEMQQLSGAVSITNTNVSGSAHNNLFINNSSGNISSLTITNGSYNSTGAALGNDGMLLDIHGTSTITVGTISGVTFSANKTTGLQMLADDSGHIGVGGQYLTVNGCFFNNNNIGADFSGADGATTGAGMNFIFSNNQIINLTRTTPTGANSTSQAFNMNLGIPSSGTFNGKITGNTIGQTGTAGSGSTLGDGIRIIGNNQGKVTVLIDNNTIRECPDGRGIEVVGRNGTGTLDATITNNNINHVNLGFFPSGSGGASDFPLAAIYMQANVAGTAGYRVRTDVRSNTAPAGSCFEAALTGYIQFNETATAIAELLDTGSADANCAAQLAGNNTGSTSASAGCALILSGVQTPP